MCWSGGCFGTLENLGGSNLVPTQVVARAAAFVTTFSHAYTQRPARKKQPQQTLKGLHSVCFSPCLDVLRHLPPLN